MRKTMWPLLAIIVMVAVVLGGCRTPAPAPAPTPTPTPAPTPAPAPEPTPSPTPAPAANPPEYQALIDKGLVDPNLVLNPYAGLAIKPDGTPLVVHHTTHILPIDWCVNHNGFMQSLVERAGGKYSVFDANLVVEAQVGDLENVAALKSADVVILHPVEENASVPAVEKVVAAGIPVFTWDADSPTDAVTSFAYHDFAGPAGTNVIANVLVDQAKKLNKTIYLLETWAIRDSPHIIERHTALHAVIDQYPDLIKVAAETPASGALAEKVAQYTQDALSAHPEINAAFGDGGGQEGIIDGLRAAGKLFKSGDPNHIIIIMNDSDSRTVQGTEDGYVDAFATHDPLSLGDLPIKLMYTSVILGQPVERYVIVPMVAVTSENIKTIRSFGCTPVYSYMPTAKWDLWPVLDTVSQPCFDKQGNKIEIPTPTVEMRQQLKGY